MTVGIQYFLLCADFYERKAHAWMNEARGLHDNLGFLGVELE
jgi:hypothetical protein